MLTFFYVVTLVGHRIGHFTPGLLSTVGISLPIYILPQAPVVQTKYYLLDKSIGFPSAYPVD